MATLKQIAKELGLSPATVSRALNGFPEVNIDTRKLVEETAKQLEYRPNKIAQKLVSGRSGMVGMIVRINPRSPFDRTFAEIMLGLSSRLAQHDIDLVFQVASESDPVESYRKMIEKQIVDGFIVNAPVANDPRIAFLTKKGIPFVVHGRASKDAVHPYFDISNNGVTETAVRHLAASGHKRIALLNGEKTAVYAIDREEGFRATVADLGIHVPERMIVNGQPFELYGYEAAKAMLADATPPSAIICVSTVVANGVYRAAGELGISIPRDLSVIAHDDDIPQLRAENFVPPLTVTSAPLQASCGPLAEILITRLGLAQGTPLQQVAEAELIERASTAPVLSRLAIPWT